MEKYDLVTVKKGFCFLISPGKQLVNKQADVKVSWSVLCM